MWFYPCWVWQCYSLSCVWLFVTPWTVARQAPLFTESSRQEYWSGLPYFSNAAHYPPALLECSSTKTGPGLNWPGQAWIDQARLELTRPGLNWPGQTRIDQARLKSWCSGPSPWHRVGLLLILADEWMNERTNKCLEHWCSRYLISHLCSFLNLILRLQSQGYNPERAKGFVLNGSTSPELQLLLWSFFMRELTKRSEGDCSLRLPPLWDLQHHPSHSHTPSFQPTAAPRCEVQGWPFLPDDSHTDLWGKKKNMTSVAFH